MNNIVEIYRNNKMEALTSKKDADIIAIKCEDATYKTIRELKKGNEKCHDLISLGDYKFSDSIRARVAEVKSAYNKDVKELNAFINEVYDRLSVTANNDDVKSILTSYGIIADNKLVK